MRSHRVDHDFPMGWRACIDAGRPDKEFALGPIRGPVSSAASAGACCAGFDGPGSPLGGKPAPQSLSPTRPRIANLPSPPSVVSFSRCLADTVAGRLASISGGKASKRLPAWRRKTKPSTGIAYSAAVSLGSTLNARQLFVHSRRHSTQGEREIKNSTQFFADAAAMTLSAFARRPGQRRAQHGTSASLTRRAARVPLAVVLATLERSAPAFIVMAQTSSRLRRRLSRDARAAQPLSKDFASSVKVFLSRTQTIAVTFLRVHAAPHGHPCRPAWSA